MTVDSHEINNSSPYQALKKIMSLTLLFQEWFKGCFEEENASSQLGEFTAILSSSLNPTKDFTRPSLIVHSILLVVTLPLFHGVVLYFLTTGQKEKVEWYELMSITRPPFTV